MNKNKKYILKVYGSIISWKDHRSQVIWKLYIAALCQSGDRCDHYLFSNIVSYECKKKRTSGLKIILNYDLFLSVWATNICSSILFFKIIFSVDYTIHYILKKQIYLWRSRRARNFFWILNLIILCLSFPYLCYIWKAKEKKKKHLTFLWLGVQSNLSSW